MQWEWTLRSQTNTSPCFPDNEPKVGTASSFRRHCTAELDTHKLPGVMEGEGEGGGRRGREREERKMWALLIPYTCAHTQSQVNKLILNSSWVLDGIPNLPPWDLLSQQSPFHLRCCCFEKKKESPPNDIHEPNTIHMHA